MIDWLDQQLSNWPTRIGVALVVTVFTVWLASVAARTLDALSDRLQRAISARAQRLGLRDIQKVSEHAVETTLDTIAGLARILVIAALFYGWLLVTAYVVDSHHTYVYLILNPLQRSAWAAGESFVGFLPNLAILVLIVAFGRVLQSMVRAFTQGIAAGRVQVLGMDAGVATPTHRILTFLLWVSMLIIAAPYLPGADSKAFQAVSVMLGVLFSLGSSSLVSNLIAGLTLTYSRAYRVGDRVRIGDIYGDVTALGAVNTRVRTILDEEIVVPNGQAMSAAIINYSRYTSGSGVQGNCEVTIGYDTPHVVVEALLIRAALATPDVVADPSPYVLQPNLEDYAIRYRVCAYTKNANRLHLMETALRRSIETLFHDAGVEICTPTYMAVRDGNAIAIPPANLERAVAEATGEMAANVRSAMTRKFEVRSEPTTEPTNSHGD
ncbi:MAG TPA: mechanosensitive ion channel domain-containing protein [Polyangiaceae bacterium]|nr:mechanosensitive ion channel domain-containing protein [Polyangiaceae bacterium]